MKVEEHIEQEPDLDTLAAIITSHIESEPSRRFMLGGPTTLTVVKKNGGYSKRHHIGGEEFKAVRCYVGKRPGLIYVFKPMDVTDYVEMEMGEAQAKSSLGDFADFINGKVGSGELARFKREAQQNAALEAEREKMAAHADKYANLGFGTW